MRRRDFLKTVPPIALSPAMRSAPRLKITDIRLIPLKRIRETGQMEPAWNPGTKSTFGIGGGSFTEIRTDQALTGIGPGIDAAVLPAAKAQLLDKDPFDIEQHMWSARIPIA
jgi:hypothetical protein